MNDECRIKVFCHLRFVKRKSAAIPFIVLISGLPYGQRQRLIQKMERSDAIILGILGISWDNLIITQKDLAT
jgi:hypothetical protein